MAIDPDSEIITATGVTAGNTGDAEPAKDLLAADLAALTPETYTAAETGAAAEAGAAVEAGGDDHADTDAGQGSGSGGSEPLAVYGDAAYGAGALLADLEQAGAQVMTKVQPPVAPGGRFAKDRFGIDTAVGTVACPAGASVPIRPARAGGGTAAFGAVCAGCPLAGDCTTSPAGRTITVSRYEAELTRARTTQKDPAWRAEYRATRPKVERKIGHLMRRKHGGRRARVRGRDKVAADFSLLAAAVNLARLGVLKIGGLSRPEWAVAPM